MIVLSMLHFSSPPPPQGLPRTAWKSDLEQDYSSIISLTMTSYTGPFSFSRAIHSRRSTSDVTFWRNHETIWGAVSHGTKASANVLGEWLVQLAPFLNFYFENVHRKEARKWPKAFKGFLNAVMILCKHAAYIMWWSCALSVVHVSYAHAEVVPLAVFLYALKKKTSRKMWHWM